MKKKIPHRGLSRHGSTSLFDLDDFFRTSEKFDLDAELARSRKRKDEAGPSIRTQVSEGRRPSSRRKNTSQTTFDELIEGPWPPGLESTYFVQSEGDVRTVKMLLRDLTLEGDVKKPGFGVATNAHNLQKSPAMAELVGEALYFETPVFIDSGAARATKDAPINWGEVLQTYRDAGTPLSQGLYVVAPDVIAQPGFLTPNMAAFRTRQLQSRYAEPLKALARDDARVIYPMQAMDVNSFAEDADRVWRPRGVNRDWAVLGIPSRMEKRMPLFPLIRYLVRFGIKPSFKGPSALPRIHFLGVGSSERIHRYIQLIRVIYRALDSDVVLEWVKKRSGLFADITGELTVDEIAMRLITSSPEELLFLTTCVETRSQFPCPPYSTYNAAGSHPAVNELMKFVWESSPDPSFFRPGTDRVTRDILGRSDVSVDWYNYINKYSDWGDLCLDAIESAESSDPCMVASAWGMDDVEDLVGNAMVGRITSDSTTLSIAAKNGVWIRNGKQSKKTTPAWWKKKPRGFRFLWNLRAMMWDRYMKEVSMRWRFPQDYDEEGFTF